MAAAVADAIEYGGALVVEAGTGTGKTLAYLVPALLSGKRVVVSTGTRTLQEQVARHDIPLLQELMPRPFVATTLKGVSNYLCRRRAHALDVAGAPRGLTDDLDVIRAWEAETTAGDRAELEVLRDTAEIWSHVTTGPEGRLGSRCPFYEQCFVTKARRAADKADLILVNHHLFFADLALRTAQPGARVLPEYDAVVFDEAHQLEDVITDHFAVSVSSLRVSHLVKDIQNTLDRREVVDFRLSAAQRIIQHLDRTMTDLLARLRRRLAPMAKDPGRVELPDDLFADAHIREAWLRADTALDELGCHAALEAQRRGDEGESAAALSRRANQLRDDLATLAERDASGGGSRHVYWGEVTASSVSLHAAPIDIDDIVRHEVVERIGATVFTSATLTSAGSFDYLRARLGLDPDRVDELQVKSPFDYGRQALLYVARDLPDPRDGRFGAAFAKRALELLELTDGGAFVLHTSHRGLRETARLLRQKRSDYELLAQGDLPRAALLDRFRAAQRAVLLGTGSFWEGVDVPGDALKLVVIDKLPFAPPEDPLVKARMRRVEARGGNPFDEYQIPSAALALKQGFGRLIRRRDDRGIVAVADRRLVSKSYGRAFLETLPDELQRTSSFERVRRWWVES